MAVINEMTGQTWSRMLGRNVMIQRLRYADNVALVRSLWKRWWSSALVVRVEPMPPMALGPGSLRSLRSFCGAWLSGSGKPIQLAGSSFVAVANQGARSGGIISIKIETQSAIMVAEPAIIPPSLVRNAA